MAEKLKPMSAEAEARAQFIINSIIANSYSIELQHITSQKKHKDVEVALMQDTATSSCYSCDVPDIEFNLQHNPTHKLVGIFCNGKQIK